MSGFVIYGSGRGGSIPHERITSIGGEPVEYATGTFMGYVVPTDCVKSVGGKSVKYGGCPSRITSIGGQPVKYSFWNNMTHIGDKPVESSWWTGRINTIGGKPVKYSKYPSSCIDVCQGVIAIVVVIGLFSLCLYSRTFD